MADTVWDQKKMQVVPSCCIFTHRLLLKTPAFH